MLQVVDLPVAAQVEAPFQVTLRVQNYSERRLRELAVRCQEGEQAIHPHTSRAAVSTG